MTAETLPDAEPGTGAEPDTPTETVRLLDRAVTALGGSRRAGQREMAEDVAHALASGRHLLVQAGTGTGKSLAYLVPLLARAVEHDERAVVSTATLALQSQIVRRDLPRIVEAVAPELPRRPEIAVVKGRRNYVCRHKLDGGYPEEPEAALFAAPAPAGEAGALGREVQRIRTWAEDTETGDRDDLVPGVSDRAWRQVSVSGNECLGAANCPVAAECYAERARATAARADLVVTNHAVLALDVFDDRQVLPEFDAVVVDEAHELVDRVTSAVAGTLTPSAVRQAASALRRHTAVAGGDLVAAAEALASALAEQRPGLLRRGLPEELAAAVALVRDAARQALSDSKGEKGDSDAGRQVARARVQEVFDLTERLGGPRPADGPGTDAADGSGEAAGPVEVVWLGRDEDEARAARGGAPAEPWAEPTAGSIHVAPLSVAARLRGGLFGAHTTVLTSATLTVGGRFDAAAGALGLRGETAPSWTGVDVGSPFDYPHQGILYVARHLPSPGRGGPGEEALDELEALLTASGGGALCLFSSRAAAERAAEAMRGRLALPVLCQGEETLGALVRRFAEDTGASLFGTMSLWQGVDVPGQTCRLVVIDRIPFPRPDDPLTQARTDATARAGGNGFMSISAGHAAVRLAQGVGRLIRTTTDRGVVAVLDPRLVTARYGAFLAASLPPFWRTTDRDRVLAALERLRETAAE